MSDNSANVSQAAAGGAYPDMPEIRILLSLRSHESRMRRRLALCDELCGLLEVLYRTARALSASGVGVNGSETDSRAKPAPASAHTICSMVRDLAVAFNHVCELLDTHGEAAVQGAPAAAGAAFEAQRALLAALDEHAGLRSWKDVTWLGLDRDGCGRLEFQWATAMGWFQKEPRMAYPALRPIVLLARRIGDETMGLLDPMAGPIAEERASAYSVTKKLRGQIDHIRTLVNRKCDSLETEMRSVQTAIVKAQSQTMALVKNLSHVGEPSK